MKAEDEEIELGVLDKNKLNELVDPKNLYALQQLGGPFGLATKLSTDPRRGLDAETVVRNRESYGNNVIPRPKSKSFLHFVWLAVKDTTVIILIVAAVLATGGGIYKTLTSDEGQAWTDGLVILVAVLIIVLVSAINDYRKQKRFEKLNEVKSKLTHIDVVREGEPAQISIEDVVVGDVVQVQMGDVICCDGVLVENHNVKTDESSMTGESDQLIKNEQDPFMLSGTIVVDGLGKMIATSVGINSLLGKSMIGLQVDPADTPLQIKLARLTKRIAIFGFSAAIVLGVVLLVAFFLGGNFNVGSVVENVVDIVLIAVGIIVVSIPEGLPVAVTLTLAYATLKMLRDNNLVRHLSACETMGGATTICSDKTGTLTINKMSVVRTSVPEGLESPLLDTACKAININSSAYETTTEDGQVIFLGSRTDVALLEYTRLHGQDYQKCRDAMTVHEVIPFSSERKKMTTVTIEDGRHVTYSKGAPEIILSESDSIMSADGKVVELDDEKRLEIENTIKEYANDSLRTICVAMDNVLLGLFGLEDPIRPSSARAVADCQRAGIVVRMVTGDNVDTAKSIARQCGIVSGADDLVMQGQEFRALSDVELFAALPRLRVLARSSPQDKQKLVAALQSQGETVAVTGDGTNDGPALKMSDVGFSMGIAGTEVAKSASDIVLMDDNFDSIVKAVMWGRTVYDSVRKFIQFQLTVNISAVVITIVTALVTAFGTGRAVAGLLTIQLLWINLLMDTGAALALATDDPTPKVLDRRPHRKSDHIISGKMWTMIVCQSIYQIAIILGLYFFAAGMLGSKLGSFIFNAFVFMQLFNEVNCRSISDDMNVFRGITRNKTFIGIFLLTVVLQFVIVTFLGGIFHTSPLSPLQWAISVGLGTGSLLVGLIVRLGFLCNKRWKIRRRG